MKQDRDIKKFRSISFLLRQSCAPTQQSSLSTSTTPFDLPDPAVPSHLLFTHTNFIYLFLIFFAPKIIVSSLSDFKELLGKPYLWVEMLLKELLPCYSAVVPSLHGDRVSAERVPGTSFSRNQQPYLASGCT